MTTQLPPLVLHVIHHLVTGGMENGLINLINNMPATRFRHAIACVEDYSDFRERLQRPDTEVIALYRSRIGVPRLRLELFRLCRRLRPMIVHSRTSSGLDALLPALLAGVKARVHGEHGWDVNDLHGTRLKPLLLRRLHAPLVHRYIAVSKHIERYLVERVGIAPGRITQIYNGVDTVRFAPPNDKPLHLLPRGFATRDSIIVGSVGRLQPVKDQATLIRAFDGLTRGDEALRARLRLVVFGDGPLGGELRSLVQSLGLNSIAWLPGAVTNVHELMRTLDVFVLPSLSEGISNTILEAMATGLPVLATAVGGNTELVGDSVTGRLFPAGGVSRLTELLRDYVDDADLRRRHALAARERAVHGFGLDKMVARYQALYEALIAGRPRGARSGSRADSPAGTK
jgi:sugar transferase (PEP-CTERM/EpsH1 system associated)